MMEVTTAICIHIAVMMLNNSGIHNSIVKISEKIITGLMLPIINTLTTAQYKTAKIEKYIILSMQLQKNETFFLGISVII